MPESGLMSQEMRDRMERIGAADLVVGLLAQTRDGLELDAAIGRLRKSLASLSPIPRAVAIVPQGDASNPALPSPGLESPNGGKPVPLEILAHPLVAQDPSLPAQSLTDGYRTVFNISQQLGAGVCAVVASDLTTVTSDWISGLLQPVIEDQYDLIAPCYARHRFEGLINRGI